jgi:ABC-type transporter Mla MlaB component
MDVADHAFAVRPGEHACCRFEHAEDGDRLAAAFILDGIARGHKVVHLCDRDVAAFESQLASHDGRIRSALARRQFEVRPARDTYLPDGRFEVQRTIDLVDEEKSLTLAEGYPALRMAGEMTWALDGAPGTEHLAEYERRLDALFEDETLAGFCQYDQGRFGAESVTPIAAAHGVEVTPELAALGRSGYLSAALVRPRDALRLTGALDSVDAGPLAALVDEQFDDYLELDLADVSFVDVAGIRALLGTNGRSVTITKASRPVRRLLGVLGWDELLGGEVVEGQ